MSKREPTTDPAAEADPQPGPVEPSGGEPATDEVAALQRECDELQARWQRAAADYQNLKRRTAADVENAVRRSLEGLLSDLLLVVDHLEMALASPAESDDARALARGVELTRDQLLGALRQEGVEPILESEEFDPARHEAVATVETDDVPAGQVVDTLRRGYTWRDRVLRFAHVRVARAPQPPAGEPSAAHPEKG